MKQHWNVPLVVLSAIKKLVEPFFLNQPLTISYEKWIEELSQREIQDTKENRELLESTLSRLNDTHVDYHIMNVEGMLTAPLFENEPVPLRDKIQQVYEQVDFTYYRSLYQQDINKLKQLFLEAVRHVSHMQVGELIIFKYGAEVSFYDLWNEFYMECRGVIIDLQDMELVASPYRKFFNFNEKPSTSADRIAKLLQEAVRILIKDKEDGSMVSVTKYKDQIVVATPGSMESSQAIWAKEFLFKHHADFLKDMPKYITFIFEAIYPENRIVIDYHGEEKMVLTNMRSTLNGTYFEDDIVEFYGLVYGIPTPEHETKSLTTLLEETKDKELHPADKKEGWVFTVKTPKEELMFKLKCEDYCVIHKIMGIANSPKIVFQQIIQDTFDDFISKVPDIVKPLVYDLADVIWAYMKTVKNEMEVQLSRVPNEVLLTKEEQENMWEVKRVIKEEIVPVIDDKLSRNKKTEIEEALFSKVYGKEPSIDKYTEKEFMRVWNMIPIHLQNQKEMRKKEGRLLGYIHKQMPHKYQALAFNYARGLAVDYLSLVDIKEIDFGFIKDRKIDIDLEE